jgi:hypothetical protein
MIKAEAKLFRLRKQRRLLQKKWHTLGARELQNIKKLEIDKMITESMEIFKKDRQLLILKILNSPSPRPFFFIIPVGKRSINPFFGLLNSSNKNAEMP